MNDNSNRIYVERNNETGRYSAKFGGADWGIVEGDRQGDVIMVAQAMYPNSMIVERVRHTSQGHPDQWRAV